MPKEALIELKVYWDRFRDDVDPISPVTETISAEQKKDTTGVWRCKGRDRDRRGTGRVTQKIR